MSVLNKVTREDIAAAKAQATALYMNRVEGHAEDWAAGQDSQGNFPRRFLRGAIQDFTTQFADPLLQLVTTKVAKGYKLSEMSTVQVGTVYTVFLAKPEADITADLKLEHEEAEAALKAKVDRENDAIIATQVALRKASVLRQREQALHDADKQLEAELLAEVRAALGAK